MINSPVHSDLDAALGVPCDQVVAGDDLVMKVMLKMVTKGGDVGTVDEKSLPDQARSHGSQYPPPSPFFLDQPLKTVLALICSSSLIFNPRVY